MRTVTLSLSLIVTAFLIGFVLFLQSYQAHEQPQQSPNKNHIDGYMTQVHYIKTDATGRFEEELITPRAEHYPKLNEMAYNNPQLTIFPHTGGAWHLTAKHGQNAQGSDQVDLWDNVKLHRDSSPTNPTMDALTEAISALPHRQLVLTDKDVTIKQPGLTITGSGLKGNLENGAFTLLKNTKTHFQPNH